MNINRLIIAKIDIRIREIWVKKIRNKKIYKYCYISYWHSKLIKRRNNDFSHLYFAARPNPGAGIGHQIANWIAGYWFSGQFNCNFAHISFSSDTWEEFLGFYQDEVTFNDLKSQSYKIRRIQLFDENNPVELSRIYNVIQSYAGKKVVFLAEQDQFYRNQYDVIGNLKKKFYTANARNNDHLVYNKNCINMAVHVRRGDIIDVSKKMTENLQMRFQGNEYFVNAIKEALHYFSTEKNIQIYLFSQGNEVEFKDFMQFPNLNFCLDMDAKSSFLHMVYADILITSKSSFSYKSALLNNGIKFCPDNFWHGYPSSNDWILLDDNGHMIRK